MFIKVIEKATGNLFTAKAIDGGYEVFTIEGERYKKLKESTFKRNFKIAENLEESKENETKKKSQAKAKPEKAEEVTPEKRNKIIAQIKKVLALAKDNPSMEEGLAAALKAQELMSKYNIHEEEVEWEEVKDQISSVFVSEVGNLVLMAWRKQLAVIVARNFRCKVYMKGNAVAFRGYTQDTKIAAEVFKTLYAIGEKLGTKEMSNVRKMYGTAKGVYNTFIAGFLKGIEEGLGEQCTALMVVTPKEVEDEFANFSKDFKAGSTKSLQIIDSDIYNKGKVEGKAAVKARQVEKKGGR